MTKYRRISEILEAVQFDGTDKSCDCLLPQLVSGEIARTTRKLYIETKNIAVIAEIGDYIIKTDKGEFYVYEQKAFEERYEKIESYDHNLNEFAKEVHQNAVDHGWWEEQRSFGDIISLCHSELSEALEEHRNGRGQREIYYNDSEPDKPEGIPIELADAIIRILDHCDREKIDIDSALKLKHEYNKTRPYRHGGKAL